MLWPLDALSQFTEKDPDAGKDRRQEEKGTTGWDGWMASPTQWTWVWASSGRWWKTGRPGVLQSMGHRESDTTERLNSNSKGMGSSPGTSFGSGREEVNECWLVIYDGQRTVVTFVRREGRHSLRTRRCRLYAKHTPYSASLAQQPVRLVLSVTPFCREKCKMELPKGCGQSTWVKSGRADSNESTTQLTVNCSLFKNRHSSWVLEIGWCGF